MKNIEAQEKKAETQRQIVWNLLSSGRKITSLQMILQYRIMRLSDIIYKFREQNHPIKTTFVKTKTGSRYAIYEMENK